METTTKQQIVNAVIEYMKLHNLSQADVASKSGVRKEYINILIKPDSNFMYDAGNKKGFIPVKYFNLLADFCGFKTEKVYWQTQPTEQLNAILSNLNEAKKHANTITLIGQTGSGKSYAANLFASKNPHDVFIVTVGSSDTLGDIIEKVCEKLKLNVGKSKSTRLRWIGYKMRELKNDGYKPMIIFDEAEYMKQAALCAIKELLDNLKEYCAIVLIGTDQLLDNIEKMRRRNRSGIPQFHRRIKFGLRVVPNIDRNFPLFIDADEDKSLKKFLIENCDNYGELHDLMVPVSREADRLKEPITISLIRKVLNLPEGKLLW